MTHERPPAAMYDASLDFYEDVKFTMKPGYRARRRARLARWLIGGVGFLVASWAILAALLWMQSMGWVG